MTAIGGGTTWDVAQYARFAAEREQPFHELLDLLADAPCGRLVDLGCGDGRLTALAARRLAADRATGVDSSDTMLEAARAHASPTVTFVAGDIATWTSAGDVDVVIANASLQWVADHRQVLARWTAALAPGGQLAVQVPANADAPSHRVARQVAARPEWLEVFGAAGPPPDPVAANVLAPEEYARCLYQLGFATQHVRLRIYPHVLADANAVVEWVKGTMLNRFRAVLDDQHYRRFVDDYRIALCAELGDDRPLFFPFKRILMWGRLAEAER